MWGVKYCHEILFGERVRFLKDLIYEIGQRYEFEIEAVGTDENHIHVFAGAHPQIPPAKLAQVIKSVSAREVFRKYPEIRKFLWGGALWQIGYYVRTVSDGPLEEIVLKYVQNQGKVRGVKSRQLKLVP